MRVVSTECMDVSVCELELRITRVFFEMEKHTRLCVTKLNVVRVFSHENDIKNKQYKKLEKK